MAGLGGKVDTSMTTVGRLELLGGNVPDIDFILGGTELPAGSSLGTFGLNAVSRAISACRMASTSQASHICSPTQSRDN